MALLRLFLTAALGAAVLSICAPSAHAAAGMEFALQDDNVFVNQFTMDRDKGLGAAEKLGVKRIRVNVLWSRVLVAGAGAHKAPKTPFYNFTAIDQLQQEAALRGIKLQLTLAGPAPAWATKNHRVGVTSPSPARYGAFVRAVVAHFKGRVDRYSLWNEPNWDGWLAPAAHAPGIYRSLYAAGYKAVKGTDPRAKVLIGELAPQGGVHAIPPLRFLRQLTCSKPNYRAARHCAPLRADGFALHPYQFTSAPRRVFGRADDVTIGSLGRLTAALDKLGRRHALSTPNGHRMDLYLTEFGYLTRGHRAQNPRTQAAWLADAFKIARRNPRVKQLLQFQLVDGPARDHWHSAIVSHRGVPQPAYKALAKLARR
jgi:hypothetical protein